ncbi:vanadium-dependent haloperoxidase [Hyalangium rubrum]|uniref:Vanadium-dependent haloperoxidase n=1 Tax=Hyalangium rubrum TaxID=3103134 RepID=A0ABU5H5Y3_9BACT|nr:vanadium-dependent haloperoxidase [Hyalangium sp. s54d21]MDY7228891.1 vanadium-dependent haloperoxidase [Hyalangium sp. s54d21]
MTGTALFPLTPETRRQEVRRRREQALSLSLSHPLPEHRGNGEEASFSSYSKGLPHNARGEVEPNAFEKLHHALRTGRPSDFENIPLGAPGGRRLTNPQAGLAYELEGADAQAVTLAPAPRFDSPQTTAEMIELYWMALLRDVPFVDFDRHADVAAAARELEKHREHLGRLPPGVTLTPRTVFRGSTVGAMMGPPISQFLLREIPYGSLRMAQLQQTVVPGGDYLTDFCTWLAIQEGNSPAQEPAFDRTRRYIRDMRDMAHYVHRDTLYQAYLNAALILLSQQEQAVGAGNPYRRSRNQEGFGTLGSPHILSLVSEVATRALKAVWFQKWFVHRRLRPEEFGGRVEVLRLGLARYPVHPALLSSEALQRILSRFGSSLLPQVFPEGCPTHPAYGAGHATVAGACVTVLKAWFDGGQPLRGPVQMANAQGDALIDYTGADAGQLTLGGELDKLAANMALGRNMAGVHWRTDYSESLRLGEQIALRVLQEQSILYNEPLAFTVKTFDGKTVKVRAGALLVD